MSLFTPDRLFSRVTRIDVRFDLLDQGIDTVLLDIDNTIRRRDTAEVPVDVRQWLRLLADGGVACCLLTNNWHADVHDLADELGLPVVAKACKPVPAGYVLARRRMGAPAERAVMVGDQLLTDVLGAHLAGMRGYLVAPLVEHDLPHMALLRPFERMAVRGRMPEGSACRRTEAQAGDSGT
ncbi:HAD-IIIA family hydrolase [Berryella wangjianweii]|uniref:HAD-IIIA family hydrolase n=1 Tax=Berryella wangjianweii TaxID=2734634 RepID=A0A6M8J854_9ACTN|nr:HAD-IIIA family hydrolase [Berryella wangjianweii]QKF07678.1 HAD-IIIA family hydrolase [Berryella wangjianweii]